MRLGLLGTLSILGLTLPLAAANPTAKPVTIGMLWVATAPGSTGAPPAFVQALRERGYEESRNLTIEFRSAEGKLEGLPNLATELVNLKPDVIVAAGTPAVVAVKRASDSIPIVMVGVGNPVEAGLVQSLGHPGANVTGQSNASGVLIAKRIQLMAEAIPGLCCVTYFWNPTNPAQIASIRDYIDAANRLGIETKLVEIRSPNELDQALAGPLDTRSGAVLALTADPLFWARRTQIAETALRRGIALFGPFRENAEAGALMAYGVNNDDEFRAVATYVDKILNGAKPADLPVEEPTRFQLVINLKTAKALGITIPQAVLLRADQVIE